MDYLFIGDVHSQARPLDEALCLAAERELVPVLLGDLFDSRCDRDDTLEVMNLVFNYSEHLLLCQSNHQWALLRYIQGKRDINPAIAKTFRHLMPYTKIVEKWLLSLPLGYVLQSSNGTIFKVAHAQFPSKLKTKRGVVMTSEVNSKDRGLFLYGSRGPEGRIFWWENLRGRDWVRVAGHYHTVFYGKESLVLDASCGDPGGFLVAYDTRTNEILSFN